MHPDIDHASGLKAYLELLHAAHTDRYCALFIKGRAVPATSLPDGWQRLLDSRLCEQRGDELVPLVLVTKVLGLFIATDLPTYHGTDRVLYLADQDSLLLARSMPNLQGRHHLDIGSGSGVLGLSARVHGARSVTAIDISARAIRFTRFNAALNGIDGIEPVHTSLQDFKPSRPFDFVTSNLPFVPVPDEADFMLSGAGGKDGLALVQVFLDKWEQLVHPFSTILMISQSPGSKYLSEMERLFLDRCQGQAVRLEAIDIFNAVAPIEIQFRPFLNHPNLEPWKAWTHDKGYTHQHYLLLRVSPATHFRHERKPLVPKLELVSLNLGSDDWDGHYREIELARAQSIPRPQALA